MKGLTPTDKHKAWTAGTKSIKFINDLKRHVRIGDNVFTQHRAARALILLEHYINGDFLKEIQMFEYHDKDEK